MAGKKKTPEADQAVTGKVENKFSKEQLIASSRFQGRRDIIEALLEDGELYTVKAVEEKINSFFVRIWKYSQIWVIISH